MLWAIASVVFLLMRATPGDPIDAILGPRAPEEVKIALRQQVGLTGSLFSQYWEYMQNLLRFNLGKSISTIFKPNGMARPFIILRDSLLETEPLIGQSILIRPSLKLSLTLTLFLKTGNFNTLTLTALILSEEYWTLFAIRHKNALTLSIKCWIWLSDKVLTGTISSERILLHHSFFQVKKEWKLLLLMESL